MRKKRPVPIVTSSDYEVPKPLLDRDLLAAKLPRILVSLYILPYLEPADLMALYHVNSWFRDIVANYGGWRQAYERDFGKDLAGFQEFPSPYEQYLNRSRATVYMLWLAPNKAPQVVGPTPPFSVRKICASAVFATVLSVSGELYAIEEKATDPSTLQMSRLRHEQRPNPKFVDVWGTHIYTYARSEDSIYVWFKSDMLGVNISFEYYTPQQPRLAEVSKIVSCPMDSWHVALVGSKALWWNCEYRLHKHVYNPFLVHHWELIPDSVADDVLDVEVVGNRLIMLTPAGDIRWVVLPPGGVVYPSECHVFSLSLSPDTVRMTSCLNSLILFESSGAMVVLDFNYSDGVILQDMDDDCVEVFYRVNSTWKLRTDGTVNHWSAYNWANGLLWNHPKVKPLSIVNPSSLCLDKSLQWSSISKSTHRSIILNLNAAEDMSAPRDARQSMFLNPVLQIAHRYTKLSLSLHVILMSPSIKKPQPVVNNTMESVQLDRASSKCTTAMVQSDVTTEDSCRCM